MVEHTSGRNDNELRAKARKRFGEGKLPRAKAVRTWGGLGSGLPCALCEQPIGTTEPEFELQFDTAATPGIRFHRQCHSIWESARHEPAGEHEHWTPAAATLPPLGVPVEVRWDMGDARSLILSCMTARDVASSGWMWINLTTKAPLPLGWRPIEWRPTPGTAFLLDDAAEQAPSIPKRA
jgi:hypothetical protein